MKVTNIKKYILGLCALVYMLVAHPSNAIGWAIGPSLGITGFYSSFGSKQTTQKTTIHNFALQMGGFASLDFWLLYAKLDGLFVLDWHKLPHKLDRNHFKHITLPLTIGVPLFGLLRPHIGFIFRIPLTGLDDGDLRGNHLIESYRKKINGYLLGLGIDLGPLLIDGSWEFAHLSVARKFISAALSGGDKPYRPQQITLRIGCNLLG
ncbi:hypothetical protein CE557_535 [Cardinium endosymbiont of Sogatella furcifera]|uniref:hypothetical protein n=1 Tax=Cardinium endosymbiont of Sogatella furcifera TaxID=650378 RepID=UPI000E105B7D|nr:hypothetical protein [Cardinium endosymbiont of Sogatella furcifera]AXI24343.1 hypothetical protein CE557_535 [Cardinium endosymbiont of Sogatella furcifera]